MHVLFREVQLGNNLRCTQSQESIAYRPDLWGKYLSISSFHVQQQIVVCHPIIKIQSLDPKSWALKFYE